MATRLPVLDEEDREELRVALVMNGGVSLAIWMGGVTLEIDRMRRAADAYGEIAELLWLDPRVDVIAGASAGGINGALLALAMARGTDTEGVRGLWMQHGSVDDLLRDPLTKDPPSVFQGDEYFLPRLREALTALARPSARPGVDHPLHLTITGTTLTGEVKGYADHFGVPVPDIDHRVRFRFRRGEVGESPPGGSSWPDDFTRGDGDVDFPVARLALAARSTASFPGAFEPSYCPVGEGDATRPDMGPVAPLLSASRWVIDGGVLVNTPFRPALDAVATLRAERQVRRVLAYVVPNVGEVEPAPADDRAEMATPIQVALDSLSRLPRVQSIGLELQEIEENNVRVQRRRRSRRCLLRELHPERLEGLAAALYEPYVCLRRDSAADDILQIVLDATKHEEVRNPAMLERIRRALRSVDPPWLPKSDETWADVDSGDWRWGIAPVENGANVALDVLRRAVRHPKLADRREEAAELRWRFHEHLAALRIVSRDNLAHWTANADGIVTAATAPAPRDALQPIVDDWPCRSQLFAVVRGVGEVLVAVGHLLDAAEEPFPDDSELGQLANAFVAPDQDQEAVETALRRVLALDVVQRSSGADLQGIEQEIELVLMSADAGNAFDARTRAEEKLAGIQVHHFGSFYKESWRANDWMWGRLDGADRLSTTLLDPRRIHQLVVEGKRGVDEIAEGIERIACESGELSAWLVARWEDEGDGPAVRAEIEAIAARGAPPPPSTALPRSYRAIRRRVQLEILRSEIPAVREAVEHDLGSRTARETQGTQWARQLPPGSLPPERLPAALAACRITEETLAGETGSDYFTKVSTRTTAVTASTLRHATRNVKGVRKLVSPLRGVALALYLLARGVLEGSRTGRFAVAVALALAGALIALWLVVPGVPGGIPLLGVTLLTAALVLAWLRRILWQALVVIALLVVVAAGYYAYDRLVAEDRWSDRLAEAAAVLLFALLAGVLGLLGRRRGETA